MWQAVALMATLLVAYVFGVEYYHRMRRVAPSTATMEGKGAIGSPTRNKTLVTVATLFPRLPNMSLQAPLVSEGHSQQRSTATVYPKPVYKAVILQGWHPACNETIIVHRLQQVLANFAAVLPAEWQFLVLYSPMCKFLTSQELGVPAERLRWEPTGKEFTPENWFIAVNRLFKLKGFWRSLNADRVLLFQPDTVLCANSPHSIEDFLSWEYIGAPWLGPWFQEQRHLNDSQRTANWDVWQMWGGNGGLSLRSPAAMLACLSHFSPRTAYDWRLNEDKWFTRCLTKLRRRIAPWHVGRHFSSETYLDTGSLGYHKPLLKDKPAALVSQIVQRCPEFQRLYEYLDSQQLWQDEKVKSGVWFPPSKSKGALQPEATSKSPK
eukprot:GGOE01020254.1.p1 GENE.GGOE01020254.1~~GGOE01020254.1.p1  ORF type:complete len:379 (+),score=75.37 GGOE01020254.1:106-1242(+)